LIAMNHFTRALHALLITGRTLLTACENHIFLCIVKPIAQPCAIRPASGIFIVLCWTATLVFLIFSASSVKRTVEVDRRWRWGWPIFAVLVAVFLLFRTTVQPPAFLNTVVLPHALWTDIFADILGLAGMLFALWGRITLGRNWNLYPGLKESHELIVRGPYQYVRHPMYTGFISMLLGAVIWYGTVTGLVWFFACFLGSGSSCARKRSFLPRILERATNFIKCASKRLFPLYYEGNLTSGHETWKRPPVTRKRACTPGTKPRPAVSE